MNSEVKILASYDVLDVEEVITDIEKSFNINFEENELGHIKTFGEFQDYVIQKMEGDENFDCTSQQIFYKLRKIISENFNFKSENINPKTSLNEIFPLNNRRQNVSKMQKLLNFSGNILILDNISQIVLISVFTISIVVFFFNFFNGAIIFVIGLLLSEFLKANTFKVKNIKELSYLILKENYANSRSVAKTFNPNEIRNAIQDIFSDKLQIEKSKLIYNAQL
ncbi:hypothetical protein SAMN05421847_0093 [Halpernia humi]|uniref:Uncharacterized protein n=1 Tax=Halpernia humi TaxID=493375 RepID=A0A1H5SB01_9FLAO|nr:hypothetical protein [Halpernia humi]SEF47752.1 hypothetical protein SAMN05421847_0093 [Halpernia humi]